MDQSRETESESASSQDARPSLWSRFLRGRAPARTRFRILGVAVGALLIFKFWLIPIKIVGFSMFPTYKPGEINYINRFAFANRDPQRGDVVSIGTTGPQVTILKRVLAVPGDMVRMRKGEVFVNGEKVEEPYVPTKEGLSTVKRIRLKEDEYWVVGDNRMISEFLTVHRRAIIGSPLF